MIVNINNNIKLKATIVPYTRILYQHRQSNIIYSENPNPLNIVC